MKKLILPVIFILLLTSCTVSSSKSVIPILESESIFTVKYMQSCFVVKTNMDEEMILIAEIEQPQLISGIVVKCAPDGITAMCGDVKINCDEGYYPLSQLYSVLCNLNSFESVSENERGYTFVYKNGTEQFTVSTDVSGTINKITTPSCEFEKR